jgi:hypothetical protein
MYIHQASTEGSCRNAGFSNFQPSTLISSAAEMSSDLDVDLREFSLLKS